MAEANITATVSLEAAVHKALATVAQQVYDDHGVRVDRVSFEWRDQSSNDRLQMVVTEVRCDTTTVAGNG